MSKLSADGPTKFQTNPCGNEAASSASRSSAVRSFRRTLVGLKSPTVRRGRPVRSVSDELLWLKRGHSRSEGFSGAAGGAVET